VLRSRASIETCHQEQVIKSGHQDAVTKGVNQGRQPRASTKGIDHWRSSGAVIKRGRRGGHQVRGMLALALNAPERLCAPRHSVIFHRAVRWAIRH
jgi:hypothetical protein